MYLHSSFLQNYLKIPSKEKSKYIKNGVEVAENDVLQQSTNIIVIISLSYFHEFFSLFEIIIY